MEARSFSEWSFSASHGSPEQRGWIFLRRDRRLRTFGTPGVFSSCLTLMEAGVLDDHGRKRCG